MGTAIENGDEQMVRGLIRQTMIDINNTGQQDETSLVQTLTYQDRRIAKKMTQVLLRRAHSKRLDLRTPHKFTGNTLLHLAIQLQDYDIIKELISHNIETDVVNKYNQTPLHLAVTQVYIDGIKLLLQADTNITEQHRAYNTILDTAAKEFLDLINRFVSKNIALVFTFPRNNRTEEYNTTYINPAIEKYLVMFDILLNHAKSCGNPNKNYHDILSNLLKQKLSEYNDKEKLIKELEGLVNKFDEMDYTTTNLSNTSVEFLNKLLAK